MLKQSLILVLFTFILVVFCKYSGLTAYARNYLYILIMGVMTLLNFAGVGLIHKIVYAKPYIIEDETFLSLYDLELDSFEP